MHSYLLSMFMKTRIVPIIKNKTGDTSDKNNYRPIVLVTTASKIFELCLSMTLEDYLFTHDQQFGFKRKHSTDFCIFTVKSVSEYCTQQYSPTCIVSGMHLKPLIKLTILNYFGSYMIVKHQL